MTCEICVMNRHAAVLAADSASTVTRWVDGNVETRYFKGANKIFQLSHHQPIGVMIFNSSDLLHVPWEILIKSFRDELAAKTFNNLDGYADEFFRFLDGNTRFFPEEAQKQDLFSVVQRAAFGLIFEVDHDFAKLKEKDVQDKLAGVIDARNSELGAVEYPSRITPEQGQRVITAHRDAAFEQLKFLSLPDKLTEILASAALMTVVKRPATMFSAMA
jgi:hypothetical protein